MHVNYNIINNICLMEIKIRQIRFQVIQTVFKYSIF